MNLLQEIYHLTSKFREDVKYFTTIPSSSKDYSLRGFPAPYIKLSIDIAKLLNFTTVVEIGSMRHAVTHNCTDYFDNKGEAPGCCEDGHSCFFWARENFETYTVDINENCITQIVWSYGHFDMQPPNNLHVVVPKDGIEFLKNFDNKIDVLYLDGWDVATPFYAERHLEAFEVAKDKLSETNLIIIDDTDFSEKYGGKDKFLTPHLINEGYIPLINGRQRIFLKL